MKKIEYEKLGEYIGKHAAQYFNKCYSYDIKDYKEDVCIDHDNIVYNEDGTIIDKWTCHIELAQVGYPPLIIEWLEVYYYNNSNDYEMLNYSKVDYLIY